MDHGQDRFGKRVAVVTGGATGIGRAIAHRLAADGAIVIVADVHAGFGAETERTLRSMTPESRFARCDVSRSNEVQALSRDVFSEHGRVDTLINNAGIPGSSTPIDQLDDDVWDRVLAVNLRGVFLCTKYFLPALGAAAHGSIVNIASTFGMVGAPHTAAYAASKGGIIALSRQLAVELGPRGIRVNAVAPGYVDNDMDQRRGRMTPEAAAANLAARESAAALQPIGRQADASEIAAAVAFLASPEASFMTGAVVPVDGGCTAFFNLGHRAGE